MTRLLRSFALVCCLATPAVSVLADEDARRDTSKLPSRTDCGDGIVCPFIDAVCCPGLEMCCPPNTECPANDASECIIHEPEDDPSHQR